MRLNRRAALAGAAAMIAAGPVLAQPAVRTRRSVSSLTATSDDVVAFSEGVRLMKRRSDALSWAGQNRIHSREAHHGNGLFLPWHRMQLVHLEQIIARLTGHTSFAMPYWERREDRFLPSWITATDSPLFERDRAEGVATLDFSTARWDYSDVTAKLATDDFPTFCGRMPAGEAPAEGGMLENYGHNCMHQLMGGLMKRPRTAALDPMFWLHHCNVDRVWATWQSTRDAGVYPADWTARTVKGFVGPDGRPTGDWSVAGTLDPRALGYGYDRLYPYPVFSVAEAGPPGATRRVPTGAVTYRLRAEGAPGQGRMTLTLPDEVVRRLREADDTLMIAGAGTVAYARTESLQDRSLEVRMATGGRERSLGSAPTFVHLAEPGEHDHRGDYVAPFRFGEEVLNLLASGDGPVTVSVMAEDLAPEEGRADAQGMWMDLSLTLTESRWA